MADFHLVENEKYKNPKEEAKAQAEEAISNIGNFKTGFDFNSFAESLNKMSGDDPEFQQIEALLTLPEEEFSLLAPIFLESLERHMVESNDKLLMVQTLNAMGIKLEDLQLEFLQLEDVIDETMKDYSAQKRDFLKQMLAISYNAISETEGVAKKIIAMPIEVEEFCKMPTYAHVSDVGMDIYAKETIEILPGETKIINTGIKIGIPTGYELQIRPKSGISSKSKLRIANAPGTIDSGYRGEIGIIVDNIDSKIKDLILDSDGKATGVLYGKAETIEAGQKIAQLVLSEKPKATFYKVEKINEITDRGNKGFGSTGLK